MSGTGRLRGMAAVLAAVLGLGGNVAVGADPAAVSAAQLEVAPGVTLAGALDADALAALAGRDMLVIDLTTAGEEAGTESERVAGLGMTYENIPVSGPTLDPAQLDRIAGLLADREGEDVIIHCATGNRAGMVWAALRLEQGIALETALQEVAPLVTREPVTAAIRAYSEGMNDPAD